MGLSLGRWLEKAQVRRPVLGAFNPLAFRGERRSYHAFSASLRTRLSRALSCIFSVILLTFAATICPAASIRGVVTDARGAKITGANVALISKGKVVATAVSTADGSFQILTGVQGRFFLVVSAKSFRQIGDAGVLCRAAG